MAHSTAILCISVMEKGEGETGKGGEDLLSPPPASRLSDFRSTTATSFINLSEQCIQMHVSFYGTVHESVETNSGGGPRRNRIVDPAKEILLLSPPSFTIFSLPLSIHFSSPLPSSSLFSSWFRPPYSRALSHRFQGVYSLSERPTRAAELEDNVTRKSLGWLVTYASSSNPDF